MSRRRVWIAWKKKQGSTKRTHYASHNGLQFVPWPRAPLDSEFETIANRAFLGWYYEGHDQIKVEVKSASVLREEGYVLTPPTNMGRP